MQLYLPDLGEELEAQVQNYGTCFHTKAQFYAKDPVTGHSACSTKLAFGPNAAYAFVVGRSSFHSVPGGASHGPRRSILINWYKRPWRL